jgi:uncharacterized membrane protein
VESFRNPELDHGYAYMPTLLYIMSFMSAMNKWLGTNISWAVLWKIPVLLADVGVFILLYRYFYKRSFVLAIMAGALWLLNPYLLARYEYTLFDPIQIFFLLLSVTLLGKHDALSGLSFGLAISIKLIPLILFPIMVYFAHRKLRLVLWTGIALVGVSVPFLLDKSDFVNYLNGAVFVHGSRQIQGRPVLSFVSQYSSDFGIEFSQNTHYLAYVGLSLISGPIVSLYLMLMRHYKSIYALCFISFCCYYLFTPILNRTHLLWFVPFMLIGLYEITKGRTGAYLTIVLTIYLSLYLYLLPWSGGNIRAPGKVVIQTVIDTYYDYRHRLFEQ